MNPYQRWFEHLTNEGKTQVFMHLINNNEKDRVFIIMQVYEYNKQYPENFTGIKVSK
jgi:hypothetical protein